MKIAYIGHKRIPGREGGVEVVVEELATRLAVEGHRVTAYNRRKKGLKQPEEYQGVKVITVPTIEKKSTDAVVYSFLASLRAIFCGYDVIHYHALGPSVFLIIPHLFHIRTVVTVHGLNYMTPKWKGLGAKFIMLGEKITARYADEIICLSREQQKYFLEKYQRKTNFIPNGVTLKEPLDANLIREKWGLQKNGYILFLSRIVPGKGLEHLLRAYRQVNTDLPLVVAGGSVFVDDFYKDIEQMVAEDPRVRLVGFAEGDVLTELYSNAALYVFPSEAEGMPMCLLEAMSFNTPCLVSDIPENTEVGRDLVQVFKTADVEDLREKLECFLASEKLQIHRDSREYIASQYDWNAVADLTLKCYKGELEC